MYPKARAAEQKPDLYGFPRDTVMMFGSDGKVVRKLPVLLCFMIKTSFHKKKPCRLPVANSLVCSILLTPARFHSFFFHLVTS